MTDRDPGVAIREPTEARGGLGRMLTGVVRGGAVAAVAGGLLVACGDDGGGGAAGAGGDAEAGPTTGGDAPAGEPAGDGGAGAVRGIEGFCAAMDRIDVRLDPRGWFETIDGSAAPALEAVGSVPPPVEITDEWSAVLGGTERSAEAEHTGQDFDGTGEAEMAAERVRSYVDVRCSIDLGSP